MGLARLFTHQGKGPKVFATIQDLNKSKCCNLCNNSKADKSLLIFLLTKLQDMLEQEPQQKKVDKKRDEIATLAFIQNFKNKS